MIKTCLSKNKARVLEKDKFKQFFEKGFGQEKARSIYIDLNETAYLLEKKKIELYDHDSKINFDTLSRRKDFDVNEYLVYKDLRSRGYNIGSGLKYGFNFRLYDKGINGKEDHSLWLVEVFDEADRVNIRTFTAKNRVAHSSRKKMLFAIVDREGSITYIENSWRRL